MIPGVIPLRPESKGTPAPQLDDTTLGAMAGGVAFALGAVYATAWPTTGALGASIRPYLAKVPEEAYSEEGPVFHAKAACVLMLADLIVG